MNKQASNIARILQVISSSDLKSISECVKAMEHANNHLGTNSQVKANSEYHTLLDNIVNSLSDYERDLLNDSLNL